MTAAGFRAVDRVQLRALLRAYFRMSARGLALVRNREGMPTSLVFVLAMYVLLGLILGIAAFSDIDGFSYVIGLDWMTFVIVGMAAVVESNEVLFDVKEDEVLLHRPIHPSTLLAAKALALIGFTSVLAVALNLFPTFFALALHGAKPWFPIVHIVSTALLVVFCSAAVVCTYGLVLRLFGRERFDSFIAYAQLGMVFFFMGSMQLMRHFMPRHGDDLAIRHLLLFTPPAWFASIDEVLAGDAAGIDSRICACVALVATALLAWLAVGKLSTSYSDLAPDRGLTPGDVGDTPLSDIVPSATLARRTNPILQLWLRDPVERAGFRLASAYMRRNREVKQRLYPQLAMFALFVFLQFKDRDEGDNWLIGLMLLALAGTIPLTVIEALRMSSHHAAADLFRYTPLTAPASLFHGVRKASIVWIQVPVIAACMTILSVFSTIDRRALELALPIVLVMPTISLLPGAFGVFLPLSQPPRRGQQSSRNMGVSMAMVFFLLVPAGISAIAIKLGVWWVLVAVELLAIVFVHRWLMRLIRRRPLRSMVE